MQSFLLLIFLITPIVFIIPRRYQYYFSLFAMTIFALISGYWAMMSLGGKMVNFTTDFPFWTGSPDIVIDKLSAFFILIINLVFLTGGIYSYGYLKKYEGKSHTAHSLHFFALMWLQIALVGVVSLRDGFAFLTAWELMAVSSFTLVIYEGEKKQVLKDGIIYLVQMHIGMLFLLFAFFILETKTGKASFDMLSTYFLYRDNLPLFLLFFVGFGIKAGIMPFHTWMPHTYASAPSHVAGIMSASVTKMGVYGLLRVAFSLQNDFMTIGLIVLTASMVSCLLGILTATMQSDMKRILAYSSIENIGVMGIGIGVGLIGIAFHSPVVYVSAFAGSLLHLLNHSIIKSLLFYLTGAISLQTGSTNTEHFGGLIKKMPFTAALFLVACLGIAGLPPFNGFISEFLIYGSMFHGLNQAGLNLSMVLLTAEVVLALSGGLSIFCFSKLYGVTFLGTPRTSCATETHELGLTMRLPQVILAALMVVLGLLPFLLYPFATDVVLYFTDANVTKYLAADYESLSKISLTTGILISIIGTILITRNYQQRKVSIVYNSTWGCGYTAGTAKQQYTATSYGDNLKQIAGGILNIKLDYEEIKETEIFPAKRRFHEESIDIIEENLVMKPTNKLIELVGKAAFIRSGKIQHYLLYPLAFLLIILFLTIFEII
jgi:formate hydrogenlyase subunit 3/multisubunit Na+/H+ antiporter MnhD subunit